MLRKTTAVLTLLVSDRGKRRREWRRLAETTHLRRGCEFPTIRPQLSAG
jgi:hypothetical protein